MHLKGLSHNDLSFDNILLVECADEKYRALLSDFSAAAYLRREKIAGFVGTPNFAHRDPHKRVAWYADEFHDKASLGFVIAGLCAHSIGMSWNGYMGSFANGGADERLEQAKDALDEFCDNRFCQQNQENETASSSNASPLRSVSEPSKGISGNNGDYFREMILGLLENDSKSIFDEKPCGPSCKCRRCNCSGNGGCTVLCPCGADPSKCDQILNREIPKALGEDIKFEEK